MDARSHSIIEPSLTDASRSCPFLGSYADKSIWFNYPSPDNYCHRSKILNQIDLTYQQKVCLTEVFTTCKVFTDKGIVSLPSSIVGTIPQKTSRHRSIGLIILGIVVLLSLGALLFSLFVDKPFELITKRASPTIAQEPSTTIPQTTNTPISTILPTFIIFFGEKSPITTPLPSISPLPSSTSPITSTPTQVSPTPGPGFQTPFGPSGSYLLYVIKEGEGLANLAYTYQTTIDVILATNVIVEGQSIWPGKVLVILPGQKDANNVTKFEVIYIEISIPLYALAAQYNISTDELSRINSLGVDNLIPAGRWIIIPIIGN